MGELARAMAAVRRVAVWLIPAGRREWAEAAWAEAHEVPPGLARLTWRAGGAWVLAREALLPRRLGRAVLFAVAAAAAAWAAWPQPGVGHAAESRFHVIATVLLLAGLPLLARRFLGPASPSRAGRSLRVFCCAAVLTFLPALAIVEAFANGTPTQPAYRYISCTGWSNFRECGWAPGRSTGGPPWAGEIVLMLLTIGYVGVILFLTARRSQVTQGTLAIGTGTGLLFGVVMFAVAPLGLINGATDPWLPGSQVDPLVAMAWVLLFGGPAVAAVVAARRCRRPDGTKPPDTVRIGQGIAAGVLANATAALFTAALGTGTIALLLKSAWLLHWLDHGQQLTAVIAYRYEVNAAGGAVGYGLVLISFPVIGLIMSSVAAAIANPAPRQPGPRLGGGGGGGGGGPGPDPGPADGGRPADADRVPVLVLSISGE